MFAIFKTTTELLFFFCEAYRKKVTETGIILVHLYKSFKYAFIICHLLESSLLVYLYR